MCLCMWLKFYGQATSLLLLWIPISAGHEYIIEIPLLLIQRMLSGENKHIILSTFKAKASPGLHVIVGI